MLNGVTNITINSNGVTAGPKRQIQTPSAQDLNTGGNMQTFTAGSVITEPGQYALKCGAVVESKYGYASQLDEVSRDYGMAVYNRNYKEAASQNIISAMNERYNQLREEIESNYSGEEMEDRLNELNMNYDDIINHNVIKPVMHNLQFETMANKLRAQIGSFYEKKKETMGENAANQQYGSMADWKEVTDDIESQLDNLKTLFEEFQKAIRDSRDKEGASDYLDSLLKAINSGMAGIEEKKNDFQGTLDLEKNGKLKELWGLIEEKTDIYRSYSKKYASDEEKYQAFLKESSQFGGIDGRMDELLKEMN